MKEPNDPKWISAAKMVADLARDRGLPILATQDLVRDFFADLAQTVMSGERVFVPHVGIFELRRRKARRVKNVFAPDGGLIDLPAVESIGLRPVKRARRKA